MPFTFATWCTSPSLFVLTENIVIKLPLYLYVISTFVFILCQSAALLGGINALHTAFPQDADGEYLTQADIILNTLKLPAIRDAELKLLTERKRRADTADIVSVSLVEFDLESLSSSS